MSVDTIKATFTYLTALIVVVGGFAVIYASRADAEATSIQLLIGGFIGSALTFLFVQENSTRTNRASERQYAQANPGTTIAQADTVTSGGPITVTDGTLSDDPGKPSPGL